MVIEQIYTGCLAQGAYYIESDGVAAIIDPLRDAQTYINRAKQDNATITHIFETHFHADFVSGHVELSEATGAPIVFGPRAEPKFTFHQAKHLEEIELGQCTIRVLHTPGHTMESTCYLLLDVNKKPHAIFTGDTLFIGDVGRPDLAQKSIDVTKEELAQTLFHSLRNEIMSLPPSILVYPAHGAGSACGKNLSSKTWDTLENQLSTNYALRADMSEEEFVEEVTSGLLPPPAYFPENVALNKKTIPSLRKVIENNNLTLSPEEFETLQAREGALILDTGSKEAFAKSHIPGSIFIGLDGNFAPWVGAMIKDVEQRMLIISNEGDEREVLLRLSRVGFDRAIGFLGGGMDAWSKAGKACDQINQVSAVQLSKHFDPVGHPLLDVRKPGEFSAEHVDGAYSIPLDFINEKMHTLDESSTYYVHCLSGYRSTIFISILKSRGLHNLINVQGGWQELINTDIPTTDFECESKIK
jgi:glyoxylase-like metal-dependent hydrolase (beta-lactamase superfamily II)/rhodanese-related sulfurtransferase